MIFCTASGIILIPRDKRSGPVESCSGTTMRYSNNRCSRRIVHRRIPTVADNGDYRGNVQIWDQVIK